MELAPAPLAACLALVAVTGFAIQRGATCMVVAVTEMLERGTASTAFALLEAALWVGGLLALAGLAGMRPHLPAPPPSLGFAVAGGVLLGLGAVVNRACVLGTIARFGSGEWAYAFTPVGILAGAALALHRLPLPPPSPMAAGVPLGLSVPEPLVAALALLAGVRLVQAIRAHAIGLPLRHRWTPHAATTVIAIAFVALLMLAGPWSWTDALVALARTGMAPSTLQPLLLVATLAASAVVGGRLLGALPPARFHWRQAVGCFLGGALLAIGALLVPGSNDGLLLLGVPLAWANGAAALAAMALTIAALVASRASRA